MITPHIIANYLPSLAWTCLGGITLTIGDLLLRSWLSHQWAFGFYITFGVYILSILFAMFSFFGENIAIATLLLVLFNTIAYLIITYYLYGDSIQPLQIAGVALGLIAVFLLKSH